MIPDHLSAFGIHCETEDELVSFCHRVIQYGTAIQVPDAEHRLVRWEASEGVHIWMYVNPANEVESLFPFYYPVSSHQFEVDRLIEGEEESSNMLVEGWLLEEESEEGTREVDSSNSGRSTATDDLIRHYKLSFVCVDAPLYVQELKEAGQKTFQLMGVSRKPEVHVDQEAFNKVQRDWGGGMDIQAKTVIPGDVLNLDADPFFHDAPVLPYAYLTGIVRDVSVKKNSGSDGPFIHAKLDTNGMNLDVLLGEEAVPTTPEQGNVLEGYFLLIGMKKPRAAS